MTETAKKTLKNQFKSCESCPKKLNGNQIERLPAEVFKNNSELAFL